MPLIAYLVSRASSVMGLQILFCTFVIRIVEGGADALGLSQLGLVATLASLAFAFPLGLAVDKMKKGTAILVSHFALLVLVLGITIFNPYKFLNILIVTGFLAVARNFRSISQFTIFGELLQSERNKNQWVNRSTLSWQVAAFLAPVLTGFMGSGEISLKVSFVFIFVSFCSQGYLVKFLNEAASESEPDPISNRDLLQFLQSNFRLHSSLALDFFVVLFAGTASLLPFLHPGRGSAVDIGILKSALPAGVICGTWFGLRRPSLEAWAAKLFLATLGYGFCHFLLADSTSLWLSYALLFAAGIFDALSLSVRENILQIETPPHCKGRVYAINNFLVNASDELSEWESGLAAQCLGIKTAIRTSGVVAMIGAGVFAWKFKQQDKETAEKICI